MTDDEQAELERRIGIASAARQRTRVLNDALNDLTSTQFDVYLLPRGGGPPELWFGESHPLYSCSTITAENVRRRLTLEKTLPDEIVEAIRQMILRRIDESHLEFGNA